MVKMQSVKVRLGLYFGGILSQVQRAAGCTIILDESAGGTDDILKILKDCAADGLTSSFVAVEVESIVWLNSFNPQYYCINNFTSSSIG